MATGNLTIHRTAATPRATSATHTTPAKRIALIALTAALLITSVFAPKAAATAASGTTGKMTITAIDLLAANTGEATMIRAGDGGSLLVDSGDRHNDSIIKWLDANGYKNKKFNTLVTHWHDDHAGNTAKIIRKYKIGTVYLPYPSYLDVDDKANAGYYAYEKSYVTDVKKAAKERGTKIVYLKKGQTIRVGSGVSGKVLYVNESPYKESWYPVQYINNQSCVIMFTGGGAKFLAAGDLQEQGEKRLVKEGVDLKADIFKLSHHGYDRSNKQFFLDEVDPSYAYFTSSKVTPKRYLSDEVRDSATRMGATANVFSTRYNGTIRFECSGGNIKVTAERNTSKMHQKLINKRTGNTRNVTLTFNNASPVRITDRLIDSRKYYNRQLASSGSSALFTGVWKNKGGYTFLRKGNVYAWNTFAVKDGKTYCFGKNKRRMTGFIDMYGRRYYFDPHMVTGWKTIGGRRYYFLDQKCSSFTAAAKGAMAQGFKTIDGKRYYFMDNSCLTYRAADQGKRMLGFFTAAGNTYYAQDSKMEGYVAADAGVIQKGFRTIDGKRYYFDEHGVMRTGWITVGADRYYAYEDGQLAAGVVVLIGGVEYEFDTIENGCALIGAK